MLKIELQNPHIQKPQQTGRCLRGNLGRMWKFYKFGRKFWSAQSNLSIISFNSVVYCNFLNKPGKGLGRRSPLPPPPPEIYISMELCNLEVETKTSDYYLYYCNSLIY